MNPGDVFVHTSADFSMLTNDLDKLFVVDSLDREFKLPKKTLTKLKKDYAEGKYE